MEDIRKRRVALISLHFSEYAWRLACALAESWDVLLVLYSGNARDGLGTRWRERPPPPGLTIVVLDNPTSALDVLSNTRKLVGAVRAFHPQVIHCQEALRDELIFALLWFPRVPVVLTIHDPSTHTGRDALRLRFSRYRFYRWLLRRTAKFAITHGAALTLELESIVPRLRNRIASIPHGPIGHDIACETGLSAGLRMLFFGRIYEYKGLTYFVQAIIALRQKGLDVIGVVAGRGDDLDRHRAVMVAAGGFEIHDEFIPADQVPALFTEARAVVLPYTDGTQSGVAAMALGYGRPVIASAVGSIPELVRDGNSGLLVPPKDVDSLAKAMEQVCDQAFAEKLVRGARLLRSRPPLSWESIARETSEVYKQTIGIDISCVPVSATVDQNRSC